MKKAAVIFVGLLLCGSLVAQPWHDVIQNLLVRGKLFIGTGTPSVTQDQGSAYLSGTLEVDGATTFDAAVTQNSTTTMAGIVSMTGSTTVGEFLAVVGETSQAITVARPDETYMVLFPETTGVSVSGAASLASTGFTAQYVATSGVSQRYVIIDY